MERYVRVPMVVAVSMSVFDCVCHRQKSGYELQIQGASMSITSTVGRYTSDTRNKSLARNSLV